MRLIPSMGEFPASCYTPSMHQAPLAQHRWFPFFRVSTALVGALWIAACPAMQFSTVPGGEVGTSCSNDLACADGLECACGLCARPGDVDRPPTCNVQPDETPCAVPPSPCWSSCDSRTEVATALCELGVESCRGRGVHPGECGSDNCPGEAAPGEVCRAGEYVCELGRSEATGACYTSGCAGEPRFCTSVCGDNGTDAFPETCLAGAFQCETGVLQSECAGCFGEAPRCVRDCDERQVVTTAFCQAQTSTFSCSHVLGAVREDECGDADAGSPPGADAGILLQDGGAPVLDAGGSLDASAVDANEHLDGGAVADASHLVDAGPDGGASAAETTAPDASTVVDAADGAAATFDGGMNADGS